MDHVLWIESSPLRFYFQVANNKFPCDDLRKSFDFSVLRPRLRVSVFCTLTMWKWAEIKDRLAVIVLQICSKSRLMNYFLSTSLLSSSDTEFKANPFRNSSRWLTIFICVRLIVLLVIFPSNFRNGKVFAISLCSNWDFVWISLTLSLKISSYFSPNVVRRMCNNLSLRSVVVIPFCFRSVSLSPHNSISSS